MAEDMVKGESHWTDENGVHRVTYWEMKRPVVSLSRCIGCVICGVLVNLHEYPNGRCWRCDFNKPWLAEEHLQDEQNIQASIPKSLRDSN